MRRVNRYTFILSLGLVGCGGSCPQAADATSSSEQASEEKEAVREPEEKSEAAEEKSERAASDRSSAAESSESTEKASSTKGAAGADPEFPEHASVSQAIAAIPRGTERANIEPDKLSEPLQNAELYEPCKLGSQHFKVKVAVWGGKAVGVDVVTSNKTLAECIDRQIRSVEWRDKVKSLNTVEYSL